MAATLPILDALRRHLQAALPAYAVELFPDNPSAYRFIHPKGAVLIGYQGSKFTRIEGLGGIAQQRDITLHLTVFARGLNHSGAALDLLDALRLAVTGYAPPHCLPCHLLSEAFLGEDGGTWQYELLAHTETQQVERCGISAKPALSAEKYRRQPDSKP